MQRLQESRPESCYRAGLECAECVGQAARQVARVVESLEGEAVVRMFFQIYQDPGCAMMRGEFESAYGEALGIPVPLVKVAVAAA